VTVSVKVSPELKEKMKKLGIKASDLLRAAIEEEVRLREVEKVKAEIQELKPVLGRIPMEDVIKNIREDREQR